MTSIGEFLSADHRRCDDAFLTAERAVAVRDWAAAHHAFAAFRHATEHHLAMEELVLFQAYEALAGTAGPSQVMRNEHVQMRALFRELADMLAQRDAAEFLGLSETLLMLMRQHNMKEEQIFYPCCDRVLAADSDETIERMSNLPVAAVAEVR